MWELDCEESWAPKYWCFWTVVLEKTLESPLDCKEIQPVHLKGDQSWVFIGRTDAEAETPVLWPPHAKSWLIGKDLMLGGIGGRRRRGWQRMRWLDGITFGWSPGVGDGQGSLACCSSWGHKESDTTEQLNWTEYLLVLCSRHWVKYLHESSYHIIPVQKWKIGPSHRAHKRECQNSNHYVILPMLNHCAALPSPNLPDEIHSSFMAFLQLQLL